MKKLTLVLSLIITSLLLSAQQRDEVWLEWGSNYNDFPFATGHSHAMLATDFDIGYTQMYLKAIEFNSWDMGGSDPVTVTWRIVNFEDEPSWDEQIGSLEGEFIADGNQVMDHVDIYNETQISGHFAIALSFPDSTFHIFGMDEEGTTGHAWFWKQDIQWVLLNELMGMPGAWSIRILVSHDLVGGNEYYINSQDISIYPNPSDNNIHIKNMEVNNSVHIFDLVGKQLLQSQEPEINISELPSGIYQIIIVDENNITVANKKLFVK